MFLPIFIFELKYRLRRPATWIYFGLLTLMAGLLVYAAGGGFGSGATVSLGGDGGRVHINSPHSIVGLVSILSAFGMLITSAIMGNPVYRDFEHRTHSLFFTTPISKWGYLGGRFGGSLVICALVFSGLLLGAFLGALMPGVEADKVGAFHLSYYLWPFVLIVVPNLLFSGAIFFSLATLTRNVLSIYIGSVLLLMVYLIAQSMLGDLDNTMLASALDAYGMTAMRYTSRYWTPAEKNTLLVPLSQYILLNRAVWLGFGLGLLAFCYARFLFSAFASDKAPSKATKAAMAKEVPAAVAGMGGRLVLPRVAQLFSSRMSLSQWWSLTKLEFRSIVRSTYFAAIVGAGVIFVLLVGWQFGKLFDTETYPVTNEMIGVVSGNFALFMLIIITYYSGELVWRERDAGVAQITDALPVPNWVPFLSKLAALSGIQVVLLFVVMACGMLLQTLKGYFHYEPGLYLTSLFGLQLPDYLLLCVLGMLVQVLVNNKYLGHFVMVVYYVSNIFKSQLGINHKLLDYAGNPETPYSDLNKYGHFLEGFSWFKLYWAAGALLLALVANVLWVRGTEARFAHRASESRRRWGRPAWTALATGLVIMMGAGGFIFYNTNVRNEYITPKQAEKRQLAYEQKYRRYKNLPQPRLVAVSLQTDIYPETRGVHLDGTYWLKNKHQRPIDTLLLMLTQGPRVRKLEFGRPATLAVDDSASRLRMYRLAQPLAPGDSLQLSMVLDYREQGFPNAGSNTDIVQNGTFMNSRYLPLIGYQEGGELSEDDVRKRNGLKPKDRLAPATDLAARQNNGLSNDADWIRFEAVVSTSPDQLAVAPGRLLKEWQANNRRYFHYKMEQPMLNFYTFLSGRYEVYKDQWQDTAGHRVVPIEIYYQRGHEYNLKRMADAVKESLSYYTANFSPYQHTQVRIIEFPKYQQFAQSFAGTIPFSEGIGFIAKVDPSDPEDVDYPFYVTAHEIAHQWWGHQVVGADVQGGTMLVETMAQYSALMVMKHHYGANSMGKFLKYEMNNYLQGRAFERKKEVPLVKVENQGYIHYRKGSGVMYALQDYIGEAKVNEALRRFVQQHAYETAPYSTAPMLVNEFRKVTPDSLQDLVTDLFDHISLYENRITDATATKLPDGRYKVNLTVESKKLVADSLGTERPVALNDYLPVGVFPEQADKKTLPVPLVLTKRRLHAGTNKLEFVVAKAPARVAIDPYNELVDRVLDDNSKEIKL